MARRQGLHAKRSSAMSGKPLQIKALQSMLEPEGSTWQAEETELFSLSLAEKQLRLGYMPGPGELSLDERESIAIANQEIHAQALQAGGTPAALDWRSVGGRNFVTDVRDQGRCGSCVAFATTAAVEATLRVSRGDPTYAIDLSEAHLFYCHARAQGRHCNNGWWVPPALDCCKDPGVATEVCYPYTAGDQDCTGLCSDWKNQVTRIRGWRVLTSIASMQEWLASRGPVVACFKVYEDLFAYRSGIYRHVTGGSVGGHCVCCVGYDDAQGCWVVKNSWGPAWGEAGYFRIAYGNCGIDANMWAVDVPVVEPTWLKKKQITGLWHTIEKDRKARVYVDGVDWLKISDKSESVFQGALTVLASAKASKSPVDLRVEDGVIVEVYVF